MLDPMWWSLSLWGQGLTIVTFKHVRNILWWRGWCLSLFADSLKGHEFQLASAKHSLIGTIDYVPTIHAPSISLGQKMVANIIKNRHPIQPMRWGKMHWRGQIFFLRVGVGAWGNLMFPLCFIRFYLVPTKFPKFSMCSQHVPNSTTCNPISFVQTSPLVTYKEKPTIYIFWKCLKSDLNFVWWANQGGPLSKSEKKFEHLGFPQLSNMNHTILYTLCNEWHVGHNLCPMGRNSSMGQRWRFVCFDIQNQWHKQLLNP